MRWRVNGVSVGAGACTMNATANRQSATSLDAGVVNFNAGDTIGIAFDTVGLLPAATNDFTVYWSVEYKSSSSSLTMQKVYDSSSAPVTVVTADAKDVKYTLSNTTTDSNFLVDIATGSSSKFAVQNNGSDIFNVNTSAGVGITGNLSVSGTSSFGGNILGTGSSTGTTGTTTGPAQTNVTTVALTAAGAFANNDVIFINNAGQDYYTRIVSGGGTTTLTVSPSVSYDAGATVTKYNVQNIGATATDYTTQANRFFQGYFLGGVVVGAGSTTISDGNIDSTTTLTLQKNGGVVNLGGNLTVTGSITGDASGLTNINAANLTGTLPALNGASITNLDAGNIATGTLNDSLLSTNVTKAGNTFNGATQLVQLDASGNLPALNGSALTNLSASNLSGALPALNGSALTNLSAGNLTGALPALNGSALTNLDAGNIATGTLNDSRLSTNVTKAGNSFNGISQLVQLDGSGNLPILNGSALTNLSAGNLTGALPALNGSALTNLDASNIATGTLSDLRLSTNITKAGNTFNGVSQLVQLDASGKLPVLDGSALTTLSAGNLSGALPAINGAALTSLSSSSLSGALPALNASALTNLRAGNLTGALPALNGSALTTLSAGNLTGALPALNGSALTSLSAGNLTGTIADARLSANVGLLNLSQSFTAQQTFAANILLGTDTATPTAGTVTFNDATASNGFTSVLGTSTLTASRSINLPDVNGTVLLLAPSAAQVDSGSGASLLINKTNASGNIMTLQKGGVPVFSVLNSGALAIQTTDTSAISINNSGGTQFFNVDTTGTGIVKIGGSAVDGTATFLVLDSYNGGSADPTGGQNGAQYYNTTLNKLRCYQNNAWKDCISEPTFRSFVSSTSVAVADNNTTNYWRTAAENNNSYPNITPSQSSGKAIMGIVTIETTATSNTDVEVTARIERGIGSVPTCNAGTQVGAQPGTFSSNIGGLKASTVQFVDVPNTTSPVYYVVCADTATVGTGANMTRIRVTLQEVNNSN